MSAKAKLTKLDTARLAALARRMLAARRAWREAKDPRDLLWDAYMDARGAIAWEVANALIPQAEIAASDGVRT